VLDAIASLETDGSIPVETVRQIVQARAALAAQKALSEPDLVAIVPPATPLAAAPVAIASAAEASKPATKAEKADRARPESVSAHASLAAPGKDDPVSV